MKRNFKGFTLVECIIALAILAIASLTMAQIYASVSQRNRNNYLMNTSLSNQMAYVEKYTGSEAHPIYFITDSSGAPVADAQASKDASNTTKYPPHKNSTLSANAPYVAIVSSYDSSEYSYGADIFILKSRDASDRDSDDTNFNGDYDGDANGQFDLRYKYLVGHTGS